MIHRSIRLVFERRLALERLALCLAAWVFVFGWPICPAASAGDIAYSLVNYPTFQNGWTLSGTIVTDGTMGVLEPTNFISASVTVSNGGASYSASANTTSQPPIMDDIMMANGPTIATPSEIILPASLNPNVRAVFGMDLGLGQLFIEWQIGATSLPPPISYAYEASGPMAFWSDGFSYPGGDLIVDGQIVIATVSSIPEPSSLVMGFVGLALVGGFLVLNRGKPPRKLSTIR